MTIRPVRKPNRLAGYDYSRNGAYFVTMCTCGRAESLGTVVGATAPGRPHVELTALGKCVDETIKIASHGDVNIDKYVVMPNHVHLIVVISSGVGNRGRSPLQHVVRNIKSFVTKWAGFPVWQKSFHDHIIRNEQDYLRIAEYIDNNPSQWELDCFHPSHLDGLSGAR